MIPVLTRLVLVRHAMPVVEPAVSSELWQLGNEGRSAAKALRPRLAQPAYLVASDEPKAIQTLQELASRLDVATDPGFREVRRPHAWSADYASLARAYVEGLRHDGWEDHADVVGRFAAAVARHATIAAARRHPLVIGTHGLAPTVWLASIMPLDPSPATFWERLTFPDLIDVDLIGRTATRRAGRRGG